MLMKWNISLVLFPLIIFWRVRKCRDSCHINICKSRYFSIYPDSWSSFVFKVTWKTSGFLFKSYLTTSVDIAQQWNKHTFKKEHSLQNRRDFKDRGSWSEFWIDVIPNIFSRLFSKYRIKNFAGSCIHLKYGKEASSTQNVGIGKVISYILKYWCDTTVNHVFSISLSQYEF